jgi:N-acetyl sugar amidotransferase
MDTSDPRIAFSNKGLCEYCQNYYRTIEPHWVSTKADPNNISQLIDQIKQSGEGRDFDCIIGISGGLDSSYTAYIAKEVMGLRPLLFHVDAGWNTDQAVWNIECLVDGLKLDLYTEVINWEEMKDLQVAFLRSQIPDQDMPQDIAFFSALYRFARQEKIKYVLTGGNYSTECCREPEEWGAYPGIDKTLILDIHKKFGTMPIKNFPIVDILKYKIYYQEILGMKIIRPLNLVEYIKKDAEDELNKKYGWKKFQHKHHESRFTRFYEDYWLPKKFGYEKRRAHLSSLIMTKQLSRTDALSRLLDSEMSSHFMTEEFDYVASKLGLTTEELRGIYNGENKTFKDYKNKHWTIGIGSKFLNKIGREKRLFR